MLTGRSESKVLFAYTLFGKSLYIAEIASGIGLLKFSNTELKTSESKILAVVGTGREGEAVWVPDAGHFLLLGEVLL